MGGWEAPLPDSSEMALFTKWATPVTQFREQWDIEQRIAINKPYDSDTARDPSELRLDHVRYERDPLFPARPYHPISSLDLGQGEVSHAAIECVSMYFKRTNGVNTGFLLFDPPRFHRKTHKRYDFWSDLDRPDTVTHESVFLSKQTCRDRFVETLQKAPRSELRGDTAREISNALLEIILEDELAVLTKINESLDSIDLSMASDDFLSKAMYTWRDRFGRWRNLLSSTRNSVEYLSCAQQVWDAAAGSDPLGLTGRLRSLQGHVHSTCSRIDSTFQAFASTMSIVESRRAIQQAETVTKLTRLAFFFVPPTLITGVFGANINEFNNQLTVWHWVVASLSTSLLTYLVSYRRQVLRLLIHSSHLLADTSLNRLSKIAIRWLTIARATWRAAPDLLVIGLWLGLNAVVIMSLWQVIESPIALEAKLGVSLAFLAGYSGAAILPLVLRCRQRRDSTSTAIMLGGILAALLMLLGMGVGVWKILGSQLSSSAKTAALLGILCFSALMSLASRLVTSRQETSCTTKVTAEFDSFQLAHSLPTTSIAFRIATADPVAKPSYNDYTLEYGADSPKTQGAVRIAKLVQPWGVKIDGVAESVRRLELGASHTTTSRMEPRC
ncbi:Endo-1,4-beta-xylanase A [Madurella mycetomatis]|uniref:Endo-1,4-beta-xylanase A n=1 Tax=Madurella mycetomatis TaxID=100816 RepID=A0A175WC61_9PEZI|nr:Endo-1,4-beta-xylanase A [Madurella mycetomatis]KXX81276.1 Endo-1,4-beta-xylanase A [Madurella mycetomatis]